MSDNCCWRGRNTPLLVSGCACPQGDMPFMVEETKNSRGARIRVTEEDAWELLAGVRGELEVGMGLCQGLTRVQVPGILGFIPTSESCLCNAAWLMQACVVQACLLKFNPLTIPCLTDMQALRTLADQVRKRERLKKQLLRNWREQLKLVGAMLHLQLNLCPASNPFVGFRPWMVSMLMCCAQLLRKFSCLFASACTLIC
jgi:hypothetical protein